MRGGFRNLAPEALREISRKGGRVSHANGTANEFVEGSQAAKEAGRKGGRATAAKWRSAKRPASPVDTPPNEEAEHEPLTIGWF